MHNDDNGKTSKLIKIKHNSQQEEKLQNKMRRADFFLGIIQRHLATSIVI